MNAEAQWRAITSGEARGVGATLARAGLTLLSGLYQAGLAGNLAIYRTGLKRRTQPALPVVSVGNLSLGGTGKSTAVRHLVRELRQRGVTAGVVLRGHGRADSSAVVLASDGHGARAPLAQTGDEAAELAVAFPDTPVAVGKRRERAIELLAGVGAQVAILDDGYQYFRMARDLNIALVSARMAPRTARVFPRGDLREPWSHLERADQAWITHADHVTPAELQAVREVVGRFAPGKPVIVAVHQPCALLDLGEQLAAPTSLAGQVVLAVSGLGCPESFEHSLTQVGAHVAPCRFDDHHQYVPADWDIIQAAAARHGATAVVTTEKDAVKLPPGAPLPVWVLRSEMRLLEGAAHVAGALDRLAAAVGRDGNR